MRVVVHCLGNALWKIWSKNVEEFLLYNLLGRIVHGHEAEVIFSLAVKSSDIAIAVWRCASLNEEEVVPALLNTYAEVVVGLKREIVRVFKTSVIPLCHIDVLVPNAESAKHFRYLAARKFNKFVANEVGLCNYYRISFFCVCHNTEIYWLYCGKRGPFGPQNP